MATTPQDTTTEIADWLEERQGRFIGMADQIWDHPELALAEHFACSLQADDLERDGFTITRNVGDLPTAFLAEWSQGDGGPKIGFLGEYDALPSLSQKRQPGQGPIVQDGPGHGCGHNLLGTAALAAASVLKAWLQHSGTAATVRYYGCPAEETCEGKVFMARAGAFDDLDCAITWHPGIDTSVWASSCTRRQQHEIPLPGPHGPCGRQPGIRPLGAGRGGADERRGQLPARAHDRAGPDPLRDHPRRRGAERGPGRLRGLVLHPLAGAVIRSTS